MLSKTPRNANGLSNLIFHLSNLPGLGERSAERMAFHILKMPVEARQALLDSINSVKDIKFCSKCFNLTGAASTELCDICSDNSRDRAIICVVEQSEGLWKIEKTGAYKGLYHILQGVISPLDNKGPDDITLRQLIQRVKADKIREIILSTNPTVEGDNTALYIQRELKTLPVKITRLGRGIPAGSNIEYLNKSVLIDALRERKEQIYDA